MPPVTEGHGHEAPGDGRRPRAIASAATAASMPKCVVAATSASAAFWRFHAPGSASASGTRSTVEHHGLARRGGARPPAGRTHTRGSRTGRRSSEQRPTARARRRVLAPREPELDPRDLARGRGPHDVRVGRVRDDRELGVRLGDRSPRVADRVHLAVAVELVTAEVAEHQQLRPQRVDDARRRLARRPRARRFRVRRRERGSARCPT